MPYIAGSILYDPKDHGPIKGGSMHGEEVHYRTSVDLAKNWYLDPVYFEGRSLVAVVAQLAAFANANDLKFYGGKEELDGVRSSRDLTQVDEPRETNAPIYWFIAFVLAGLVAGVLGVSIGLRAYERPIPDPTFIEYSSPRVLMSGPDTTEVRIIEDQVYRYDSMSQREKDRLRKFLKQ